MFGRIFLLIVSIASLAWIVYVGYDLLDRKDFISPERVFTEKDGPILIVNRTSEIYQVQTRFKPHPLTGVLLGKLFENPLLDERIFCCENSTKVLISRQDNWTQEAVGNYFQQKGINCTPLPEGGYLLLQKYFKCRFKRNYILITLKDEKVDLQASAEWPTWDAKASACVIHLSNPLQSTNAYVKPDGQVVYQTEYGKPVDFTGINDAELFAQVIPSKATDYHFCEKKYARKHKFISASSPLYQWMESGMVSFNYDKEPCLIADNLNADDDPVYTLAAELGEDPDDDHFSGIRITNNFPEDVQKGFYLAPIADKVLFCASKEVLDRVLADYELGNTVAQKMEAFDNLYGKLPARVSERIISADNKVSLTAYRNLLIQTVIADKAAMDATESDDTDNEELANASFGIVGTLKYLAGNEQITYGLTSEHELFALSNKRLRWKMKFMGEPLMAPRLIDYNGDGQQDLVFNTSEKVYVVGNNGQLKGKFPIDIPSEGPLTVYRWNNRNFIVLMHKNTGYLHHIDAQGKVISKTVLNTGTVSTEIPVVRLNGALKAYVNGVSQLQEVDLDRGRKSANKTAIAWAQWWLKENGQVRFYGVKEGKLTKSDEQGRTETIGLLGDVLEVRKIYRQDEPMLCFWNKQQVGWISPDGSRYKVQTACNEIADADILFAAGKTFVVALDALDNNIYVYDDRGKMLHEEAFEGRGRVKLSWSNGHLNLTTTLQNSVVQYYEITR